nr:nuclear transport factor 2 family protein [Hyphomonas sp. Mor2]
MKAISTVLVATLLLGSACAQDEVTTESQILAQEEAWAAALLANDLDSVDAMMHRDFRLVRAYGTAPPISKEMYLGMEGMSASSADVTSVNIVSEAGPIVVARVTWSMDWAQEGVGKLPPHFDMFDTWVKEDDGEWLILSRVSQIADAPYSDEGAE